MSEIVPEENMWYPGPDYIGRQGDFAKRSSEVIGEGGRGKLVELVQQRVHEDGEWAIQNELVGNKEDLMRKMMAWAGTTENIIQCYESRLEYDPTVDWICRELANVTHTIARNRQHVTIGRKVRAMHLEGFSNAQIAKEIGVSERAVEEGLKEIRNRGADD